MFLAANVQAHVIVGGFHPVDVVNFHEHHSSAASDGQPIRVLCPRLRPHVGQQGAEPLAQLPGLLASDLVHRATESGFESFLVERFKQIVHSVDLEGFQSEVIMRPYEDHRGHSFAAPSL